MLRQPMNGWLLKSFEELDMNDNSNLQSSLHRVSLVANSKALFEAHRLKTLVKALARHAAASDHAARLHPGALYGANDNTAERA